MRAYLIALLVATVFATFVRTFLLQAYRIPSDSMAPGLVAGDLILVNKFIYGAVRAGAVRVGEAHQPTLLPMRPPRRGDVAVFTSPEALDRHLIKRCLGLPWEDLRIESGNLWIDGEPVEESGYLHSAEPAPGSDPESLHGPSGSWTVPPGGYFFLGDHRQLSRDSRSWGPIPSRQLRGRAVIIFWSFGGTEAVAGSSIWDMIQRLSKTRFDRSFRLVH